MRTLFMILAMLAMVGQAAGEPIQLFAAGSLRDALTERKPKAPYWFGGIIQLPAIAKPGLYQVTLSDEAWIDVVQNGPYARSIGSTGRSDCPGLRKSVRFELDAGPIVVQLSGVMAEKIVVVINRNE